MRYDIIQRWSGGKGPAEILEADFQAIRQAKEGVVHAMAIEEKLDLLLDNFIEYEGDFLQLALRSAVFEEYDWSDFRTATQRVNRRLANLLTTCRLYLDQTPHELGALNDPTLADAFKTQKGIEYDNRLGYRTMETLRNYLQHRDLPVRGVSYKGDWVRVKTREWRKHIVEATIDIDRLKGDPRFKQSIYEELKAQGEGLDFKRLVREYISGIGSVHNNLRLLLAPRVKAWDERIRRTLQEYQAATNARLEIGVQVLATGDQGEVVEELDLFTGPMDRRQALERKNRNVGYWTEMLVTSE